MNVLPFIEYLQTLPPETEVYVVEVSDSGAYMGMSSSYVPLVIEDHTDFLDMRNNQLAKGKPYENAVDLHLGIA